MRLSRNNPWRFWGCQRLRRRATSPSQGDGCPHLETFGRCRIERKPEAPAEALFRLSLWPRRFPILRRALATFLFSKNWLFDRPFGQSICPRRGQTTIELHSPRSLTAEREGGRVEKCRQRWLLRRRRGSWA